MACTAAHTPGGAAQGTDFSRPLLVATCASPGVSLPPVMHEPAAQTLRAGRERGARAWRRRARRRRRSGWRPGGSTPRSPPPSAPRPPPRRRTPRPRARCACACPRGARAALAVAESGRARNSKGPRGGVTSSAARHAPNCIGAIKARLLKLLVDKGVSNSLATAQPSHHRARAPAAASMPRRRPKRAAAPGAARGRAPLHARGLLARDRQRALQRHLLRRLLGRHALQLRLLQVQQLGHLRAARHGSNTPHCECCAAARTRYSSVIMRARAPGSPLSPSRLRYSPLWLL